MNRRSGSVSITTALVALASLMVPNALAADGELDTSFNATGWTTTDFPGYDSAGVLALALQPDGKIVAAGYGELGSAYDYLLARYNADGSLDTSFDTDGWVAGNWGPYDDVAAAVAIQSDGKIVVAGTYFTGGGSAWGLARYDTDGSLDTSFDTDGQVTTILPSGADLTDMALQSNDQIVVTGYTYNTGGNAYTARYDTDGSLDTSFDEDGIVSTAIPGASYSSSFAVGVQSDGKVVSAGYTFNGTTNLDLALIRYETNGALDTSFDTDGIAIHDAGTDDWPRDLAFQSDGKIVVAGDLVQSDFQVARFNTDGSLDTSFGAGGFVSTSFGGQDQAKGMVIQANGQIVAAGCGGPGHCTGSDSAFVVARYNTHGSLDASFDADGKVVSDFGLGVEYGSAVALQPNGRIIVGGAYHNGDPDYDGGFLVARYLGTDATSRVFATSVPVPPNVGLAGADEACNDLAAGAALGSTWVAWLSTSTVDARDRLWPGSGPFVQTAGSPLVVANDIAELTSGTLQNPIAYDQDGGLFESTVWTGTLEDGTADASTCNDWMSILGSDFGTTGSSAATDLKWTEDLDAQCDQAASLYCFENPPRLFDDGFETSDTSQWNAVVP